MKDEDAIVCGEPKIALDPGAQLQRGREGGKAVLRKRRPRM
jgi:hypothetical protein